VPDRSAPNLGLFIDILCTLERIEAPYMIIGAFAGTVYGVTRVTYDIDIVVDLTDTHMRQLASAYPLPRYYADVEQMRNCFRDGAMFNIIDSERGEKADLIPMTTASRYRGAFARRLRQTIDLPETEPLTVWCATPEDVIFGKLMAWDEGRSRKHEADIQEIMVRHYLGADADEGVVVDEGYVDAEARGLSKDVAALWEGLKESARKQAILCQSRER